MNEKLIKKLKKRADEVTNAYNSKPNPMRFKDKRKVVFGIHLYRSPVALSFNNNDFREFFDTPIKECKDAHLEKEKYSVSWGEWTRKIKKVAPFQYYIRHDLYSWFDKYIKLIDIDFDEKILGFIPEISWNRDNWYVKDVRDWWYRNVRCKLKPFNVIKVDTLPITYCDDRERLVHVLFKFVTDFADNQYFEVGEHIIDGVDINKDQREKYDKLKELSDWWKNKKNIDSEWERKEEELYDKKDQYTNSEFYKTLSQLEMDKENELEEKLIEIVKLRLYLWD